MSFTIRKTKHRAWPVSIALLEADAAGNVQEHISTFVAHFRPFTEDEFETIRKGVVAAHPVLDEQEKPVVETDERVPLPVTLRRNADLFAALMVGWGSEVTDEMRQPIPFSAAALAALVTGPDGLAVSVGINTALGQLRFGIAPAKNEPTSPAPGLTTGAVEVAPTN